MARLIIVTSYHVRCRWHDIGYFILNSDFVLYIKIEAHNLSESLIIVKYNLSLLYNIFDDILIDEYDELSPK